MNKIDSFYSTVNVGRFLKYLVLDALEDWYGVTLKFVNLVDCSVLVYLNVESVLL